MAARLVDELAEGFLAVAELADQPGIGLGLFDCVEVLALDILYKRPDRHHIGSFNALFHRRPSLHEEGKDEDLKREVYDSICDTYIMQYRDPSTKPIVENVEETNDENDDITKNAVQEE